MRIHSLISLKLIVNLRLITEPRQRLSVSLKPPKATGTVLPLLHQTQRLWTVLGSGIVALPPPQSVVGKLLHLSFAFWLVARFGSGWSTQDHIQCSRYRQTSMFSMSQKLMQHQFVDVSSIASLLILSLAASERCSRKTCGTESSNCLWMFLASDLQRIQFHNGQRYSVIVNIAEKEAGRSFYLRATMDTDCWGWWEISLCFWVWFQ